MNNSCLVLEGGGLRGAFTSGVLEFFLENDIQFERVVGVSAGACTGATFVAQQKGRNWNVNVKAPNDSRFMGMKHLLLKGSYFNMPFIFDEIPERIYPYDEAAFYRSNTAFDAVITSAETGERVVFSKNEISHFGLNRVLQASSSIPVISQPVNIGGRLYFDGGISDSIPAKYALERHRKAVVVLTRPRGYRKNESGNAFLYKKVFRKNPAFMKAILSRNAEYNKALDFCFQMEKEGRLYIIAPSPGYSVGRTERSFKKRADFYNHGYRLIRDDQENLFRFLNV